MQYLTHKHGNALRRRRRKYLYAIHQEKQNMK
jgi:hypothetical protein